MSLASTIKHWHSWRTRTARTEYRRGIDVSSVFPDHRINSGKLDSCDNNCINGWNSPIMTFTSNLVDEETSTPTLSHYSRFWWRVSDPGRVLDVTTNTLTSIDHRYLPWLWLSRFCTSLMFHQVPGLQMWSGWWPGHRRHPEAGPAHQEGASGGKLLNA